jgi:hypothetical protein
VELFAPETCEIGKYTITAPEPPSLKPSKAKLSRASAAARMLRLPPHLSGATIAVRGSIAAPFVKIAGPGLSLSAPAGGGDLSNSRALIIRSEETHTTYITLWKPAGGRWSIAPEPGSAPIVSVKAALPAPRAQIHAHVSGKMCRRTLTYTARIPDGESVALYAQDGDQRLYLGNARRKGSKPFAPEAQRTSRGEVLAVEMRGKMPRSVRTVAGFHTVALRAPERVSRLRLRGRMLSWEASCGASSYQVVVKEGRHLTRLHASKPQIRLPKLKGRYTVSVTAISATGAAGAARKQSF